jgi:hypothetical protein
MATTEHPTEEKAHQARTEDEPLEKREPSAPFAMVGLMYMVILMLCALAMSAFLYLR